MSIVDIGLVGDIMIGRHFNENPHLLKNGNGVWGNTKSILKSFDVLLGNLETTLTNGNDKWPNKTFNYKLSPRYAKALKQVGFDYVSIANNHILDFKADGLNDTMNTLNALNIGYSGACNRLDVARTPAIIDIDSESKCKIKRLAIFGAANHYDYWAAGKETEQKGKEGIWYIDHRDPNTVKDAVAYFKEFKVNNPDTFVILSYHWSDKSNYEPRLPRWKRTLAKKLFRAGVDLIHGHSPHHIQPFEVFDGKFVFYSLGDFVDDYAIDARFRNDIGMIAHVELDTCTGNVVGVGIQPTKIKNFKVNTLTNKDDFTWFKKKLKTGNF